MSYLKYQAKVLKGVLEELQLEPQHIVQLSELMQECKITKNDILDEGKFRKPLNKESIREANNIIDEYVTRNRGKVIMAFTDGAVGGECSDICSAASVLLPLELHGKEIEKSEVLDKAADPVETEVIAIALSLESAIEYCQD